MQAAVFFSAARNARVFVWSFSFLMYALLPLYYLLSSEKQPTLAIVQRTLGIGQRTLVSVQRTLGIGQRTLDIDQRTIGQRTSGIGQRALGIGQRTANGAAVQYIKRRSLFPYVLPSRILDGGENAPTAVSCLLVVPEGSSSAQPSSLSSPSSHQTQHNDLFLW
jgi:hypothetical protein